MTGDKLDIGMLCDLAAINDFESMTDLVVDCFSNVPSVLATFCDHPDKKIDKELLALTYQVLASTTSTSPIRAVLQGAQHALGTRGYNRVTFQELQYILIILKCPAFLECSMFTKITGPLQKLGRYSSLRSRARVLLERSMGLLSFADSENREHLVNYLAAMETAEFHAYVDLLNSYIGHRLMFHYHYKSDNSTVLSGGPTKPIPGRNRIKCVWYNDDWRIAVFAKTLEAFYHASKVHSLGEPQKLQASAFYNTMTDFIELGPDYDVLQQTIKRRDALKKHSLSDLWEAESSLLTRFSFSQYPFLLTIASKSIIFRHSVQRQLKDMQFSQLRAPQQLMSSASSNCSVPSGPVTSYQNSTVNAAWTRAMLQSGRQPVLHLRIRRERLLEDSMALLLGHSEIDLKRPLRIEFENENGIDAGGLCKEWMHLLFRELVSEELGLFVRDEDSVYNWFGTKPVDYYLCFGIALGLAFNNGVMIDTHLPELVYYILLEVPFSLAEIEKVWPAVARSLKIILGYNEPDFAEVFGLWFTAPDDTPLCPDGNLVPVTCENKTEYVDRFVAYLVRSTEQFAAFQAGFFRVCDNQALKMFQAEEVELLIRGDRKPIDIQALKSVTKYLHFRTKNVQKEPVVVWFWEFFESLNPTKQALLLLFITATDRIPATGVSNMQFRISCLGPDSNRLPVAHTCFNQLGLYRYSSKQKLINKLTLAMTECQSFGIK